MNIAVTAASGRLGKAVLGYLAAVDPVAVVRDPERAGLDGIQARAGDYASIDSMIAALAGIDTVVMISAPVKIDSDRVTLHRNVIAAARSAHVRRVIYTSVIGGGGEEDTLFYPTQQVNRQAETDLAASGLSWTVLRNGLYLDLDLGHIRRAGPDGVYANPGATGRAGYISIDEIAYATARVAATPGHAGRTYNLVGECMTQAELVAIANEVFGLSVRYEPITDDECIARFARLMPERGEAVARMLTGCFQCIRKGAFDVPSHYEAAAGRKAKSVRRMMEELR